MDPLGLPEGWEGIMSDTSILRFSDATRWTEIPPPDMETASWEQIAAFASLVVLALQHIDEARSWGMSLQPFPPPVHFDILADRYMKEWGELDFNKGGENESSGMEAEGEAGAGEFAG